MTNNKTSVTITMDSNSKVNGNNNNNNNNNLNKKRKGSWDSKVSVSTVSTRALTRSETPSSILSSDSDIRFTRKVGAQYRCGCCVLAAFILLLLFIALGLYLSYTLMDMDPGPDRVFRGTFRVTRGDVFAPALADPTTRQFRDRAKDYRERLTLIFRRSAVRSGFEAAEVLAFDGVDGEDLVVHFNLRFNPQYGSDVTNADLLRILHAMVLNSDSSNAEPYLQGLEIDPTSLTFREEGDAAALGGRSTSKSPVTTSTTEPPPPRRCQPIQLDYCKGLPYNTTSYPNIFGHKDIQELRRDVIAFRELVDAECYRLAYEFVCQTLQPACMARAPGHFEDRMVPPCRSFCRDFLAGCGSRVPQRFRDALQCSRFPEYSGPGSCANKPETGCVEGLQQRAHSSRICDGVADCVDLTDETQCSYCPEGALHCGTGRACIDPRQRCDGKPDCPGGSDEKACLSVAPRLSPVDPMSMALQRVPHLKHYHSEGYVVFNEKGESGKLCTENLNSTVPAPNREATLRTIAASLCTVLSYQKVEVVRVQEDEENTARYVHMEDPTAQEITFVPAPCPRREVLYVGCSQLECGIQTARREDILGPGRMASVGDWPWHVALFKDGVHACDATLIAPQWLLSTSSCFQGQGSAEWVARVGTVRLASHSPWEQEREVVGRADSPVEGSMMSLLRLREPFQSSDFARPVCLPDPKEATQSHVNCNTLGWTRNREMLQRVEVHISAMDRCENISITPFNSICTDKVHPTDDCDDEELAGSPLMCLTPGSRRWSLVGVTNWRIACSKKTPSAQRPRLYDKVFSNLDWIRKTTSGNGNILNIDITTQRSSTPNAA